MFIRYICLLASILSFCGFLLIWINFDLTSFIFLYFYRISDFFVFGLDGLSLSFILLTSFIFPLCFLGSWTISNNIKEFCLLLLFLEILLFCIFFTLDIFLFYIFFEFLLIPMVLIIGLWGTRARKIKAFFYFFFYTFAGSLLMLFGLIIIYFEFKTTNYIQLLISSCSRSSLQFLLWFLFFFSFAIKIPMFPFHIWLPEAHVEAPTIGSVLLASLLLKLGCYGFLRFLIMLFPVATINFTPFLLTLSMLGILYASITILRQVDIKKIVAYSSIIHMNYGLLGLFSNTLEGLEGALLLMISHGFSSGALFFCIGFLYDRHHTRLLHYYGGIVQIMPLFTSFFFFFILANFGFPGTLNFISEILIFNGLFVKSLSLALLSGIGLFFSVVYSILLYNRICFGELKINYNLYIYYSDLNSREFIILFFLSSGLLYFGLYPAYLLDLFDNFLLYLGW
jgi:NADH-quinone oxidoreductase subunit M